MAETAIAEGIDQFADAQGMNAYAGNDSRGRDFRDDRDHEAILQAQTYTLLQDKNRLKDEADFLRHYVTMTQQHHVEHHNRANAMFGALDLESKKCNGLQEELRQIRTNIAVESTAVRQTFAITQRRDAALAKLHERLQAALSQLRAEFLFEEAKVQEASKQAAALEQQLQQARAALQAEEHVARNCKSSSESAEKAHAEVAGEAAERDEHAAVTLQQALNKLETDFAQERAVHEARGRTHEHRQRELELMLGDAAIPRSPSIVASPSQRLRGSPSAFLERVATNAALAPPVQANDEDSFLQKRVAVTSAELGCQTDVDNGDVLVGNERPRPPPLESITGASPMTSPPAATSERGVCSDAPPKEMSFFGLPVASASSLQLLPPEAANVARATSASQTQGAPRVQVPVRSLSPQRAALSCLAPAHRVVVVPQPHHQQQVQVQPRQVVLSPQAPAPLAISYPGFSPAHSTGSHAMMVPFGAVRTQTAVSRPTSPQPAFALAAF
eukprot:TRINITY_DN76955_c0_g1_i1.p1 TRINITY_DN76955_c0_g1~~TRINITY_DN76955_c0_g1_i1.p1  ORF type:complete len:501 (-),score=103.96 TRINITY_DN76955_c0_g1_i1:11-1513(-)